MNMMQQMGDMAPMTPYMMGCCSLAGLFWGLWSMATPLIAIGAIIYLLTRRPQADRLQEDF